jgi:hypothetical protein
MSTEPKTVEGIYRDGKVELLETPSDVIILTALNPLPASSIHQS